MTHGYPLYIHRIATCVGVALAEWQIGRPPSTTRPVLCITVDFHGCPLEADATGGSRRSSWFLFGAHFWQSRDETKSHFSFYVSFSLSWPIYCRPLFTIQIHFSLHISLFSSPAHQLRFRHLFTRSASRLPILLSLPVGDRPSSGFSLPFIGWLSSTPWLGGNANSNPRPTNSPEFCPLSPFTKCNFHENIRTGMTEGRKIIDWL